MSGTRLTFLVPVRATFTLNSREHWSARARKRKAERALVALRFRQAANMGPLADMLYGQGHHDEDLATWRRGCVVTLTRIGPRKLDSDNVQGALKAIRDEVAAQLGIDDGDPRIEWRYAQEKGDYAVRVCIEAAEEVAA